MFEQTIVFVDLETTGGSIVHDRITEVGIIEVGPAGVSEWSTLVNPQIRIPPFIEKLTGISNAMVESAPTFAEVAEEVLGRLVGKLFVAHNARFDYGFLKNEFKRLGLSFRATVACSVKLSRRLFPDEFKHNLDSIIARHRLPLESRHRALADARAVWLFVRKMEQERPVQLRQALADLTYRPALPPHLDPEVVDDLPEAPGVYFFYGENDIPLYVGKSTNLRKRVMQHFTSDVANGKEMQLAQQLRRLDWVETAGELGAQLLEMCHIKALQPALNRRLRRNTDACSWQLRQQEDGFLQPELIFAHDPAFGLQEHLYGIFGSQRDAQNTLRKIAELNQLCLIKTGLEAPNKSAPRPCSAYQIKRCRGACIGREDAAMHNIRLLNALGKQRLQSWPFAGPIGIRESDPIGSRTDIHVIDRWVYLGTASSDAEVHELLEHAGQPQFDIDSYKLLSKQLKLLEPGAIVEF